MTCECEDVMASEKLEEKQNLKEATQTSSPGCVDLHTLLFFLKAPLETTEMPADTSKSRSVCVCVCVLVGSHLPSDC